MQILLSKLHYFILETATIVSLLLSVLVLYAYAMDPSILNPSLPTVCWSPKHILLDSIPGQDSINLCDIFKYSDGYAARVAAKTGAARLCLPVEAYPPTEEEADSIRSKIIHAAKTQADTYLVKGRVDRRQNGEVLFYLIFVRRGTHCMTRRDPTRKSMGMTRRTPTNQLTAKKG